MNQRLKIMTLVACATVAFAAMTTTAEAGEWVASSYPAALSGEQTEAATITTQLGTLKCSVAKLSSTLTKAGLESIEATPTFEGCAVGTVTTDYNRNGCFFVEHAESTINDSPDEVSGSLELQCPTGQKIEFTYTNGPPDCTLSIPPQKEMSKVTFRNKTLASPMDVEIIYEIENMHYTLTGKGCSKEGTFNDGTYYANITTVGPSPNGVTVT